MATEIRQAFDAIGADLIFDFTDNRFEIDVLQEEGREAFVLSYRGRTRSRRRRWTLSQSIGTWCSM